MLDRTVALISHENTPIPGTDICVAPGQLDIVSILINTIAEGTLRERQFTVIRSRFIMDSSRLRAGISTIAKNSTEFSRVGNAEEINSTRSN